MEKLNLVKILKDCPKGTKLYSPALGECALEGVIDNNDYPIQVTYKIINNDTRFDYFTKDGYILLNKPDAECMLFPSKDKRDWSKWQRPFVKGDILVSERGNIVLCSHIDEEQVVHYHCLLHFWGTLEIHNGTGVGYSYNCNLANDSQKQRLFDALKKEGYEWDAEKKELKTLQPFKDGDVVTYENQIAIFKKYIFEDSNLAECYVFLDNNLEMDIDGNYYVKDLATEEEKAKLFQVIKDNGYKWNAEEKKLEKLIEPKFKVGDRIKQIKTGNIYEIIKIIPKSPYFYITNYLGSDIMIPFNKQDEYELVHVEPKFKVGDKIRHKTAKRDDILEICGVYNYSYGLVSCDCILSMEYQNEYELVPNKFDTKTLKPFDKVLVRQYDERWHIQFFETMYEYDKNHPFRCLGGKLYSFCIPYIGNEHLLDTMNEPSEFYRYWEE